MKQKNKKAQSALEFTILIGFSLILITAMLLIFQRNIETAERNREEIIVEQMFNLIMSEFDFAEMSRPVYDRTFYLPLELGGRGYSLDLRDGVEIVIDYMGRERVRFLTNNTKVDGEFNASRINNIRKICTDCVLYLNIEQKFEMDGCGPGTILDMKHSLCWEQNLAGTQGNFNNARIYCTNLDLGNYASGWRLPTIEELRTLIENCQIDCVHSYLNNFAGFEFFLKDKVYWSSNVTSALNPFPTIIINMDTKVEATLPQPASSPHYICVRTYT